MMVSETAVASVIVDVHLRRRGLLPPAPPASSSTRSTRSTLAGEPVDALTVTEQLTNLGELDGVGGQGVRLEPRLDGPGRRQRGPLRADRQGERDAAPPPRGVAQDPELGARAGSGEPRDLVEQAERMMFEVAHDTASQDFASITDDPRARDDAPRGALRGQARPDRNALRILRPRRDHRRLPAGEPHHLRGKAVDGEIGGCRQHRRLRRGREEAARRLLLARDVGDGARPPLPRVPADISGDKLREGAGQEATGAGSSRLRTSSRTRRSGSTPQRTSRSSSSARRRGASTRRRAASGWSSSTTCSSCAPTTRGSSRVEQVGSISRGLKLLAGELDVPVIWRSRSSRVRPSSGRTRSRCSPTFARSGNLEQDADVVCFIFRQEYYEPENQDVAGLAELIIAKHRNGPIGNVELAFQARRIRASGISRKAIAATVAP